MERGGDRKSIAVLTRAKPLTVRAAIENRNRRGMQPMQRQSWRSEERLAWRGAQARGKPMARCPPAVSLDPFPLAAADKRTHPACVQGSRSALSANGPRALRLSMRKPPSVHARGARRGMMRPSDMWYETCGYGETYCTIDSSRCNRNVQVKQDPLLFSPDKAGRTGRSHPHYAAPLAWRAGSS